MKARLKMGNPTESNRRGGKVTGLYMMQDRQLPRGNDVILTQR